MTLWEQQVAKIVVELPKFKVKELKFGSAAAIAVWNTVFMKPEIIGTDRGAQTLKHEVVHLRDQHKWLLLFPLSYYLILPVGPSIKAVWEWRGYKEDLKGCREEFKHLEFTDPVYYTYITDYYCQWVSSQFVAPLYLWMWPFQKSMYKKCQEYIKSLP